MKMDRDLLVWSFICCSLHHVMGVHMEPKCSKFDYDERLLEKMIKLEHSTGLMMKSFNEISTQIGADLADMKREFNDIKQQITDQKNSLQDLLSRGQTDLATMKTEFAEVVNEQRKQANEAIESELTAHRKTIEDLKGIIFKYICFLISTSFNDMDKKISTVNPEAIFHFQVVRHLVTI